MYRTGDLGKRIKGGHLEFYGRVDDQVKIRGHRIEIGEIENTLSTYDDILENAVIVNKDSNDDKYLAAFIVLRESEENDSQPLMKIRNHLMRILPEYMIPSEFVFLEKLPLTPNGKIDRKVLTGYENQVQRLDNYVAPRNEQEAEIAKIWAEVLDKDHIGIYDNFFELGGHSLKVTRVLSRIGKVLESRIPIQSFFSNPTIAGIMSELNQDNEQEYIKIPVQPKQEYYPVSHSQKSLWVIDRLESNLAAYNMPSAYILRGQLKLDVFKKAIQTVIRRHESLRTGFKIVDGEPVQYVNEDDNFDFTYKDLSAEIGKYKEVDLISYIESEAAKPFDLTQSGLIRTTLLKINDLEHLALITMHHIISDEWSSNILISELTTIYGAYARGEEEPLSPLRIQYRDYAAWQKEFLSSEEMLQKEKYWLEHLNGELTVLNLPTDYPRPAQKSFVGEYFSFEIEDEILEKISMLAKKQGTTIFMSLLSAYYIFLYRYTGQEDITVGVPIAGRQDAELESLIGYFVNSLPLRLKLDGEETFIELLEKVKEVVLNGFENQDYPFDRLVESLNVKRDISRSAVFDTMFNFVSLSHGSNVDTFEGVEVKSVEGVTFEPAKQVIKTSKFDLTLNMSVSNGKIYGGFEYCTALFKTETIQKASEYFKNLLVDIIVNSSRPIGELNLLSETERKVVMKGINSKSSEYPEKYKIEQFFKEELPAMETDFDTTIYILDKKLQSVPIGVVGEIYIEMTNELIDILNPEIYTDKLIAIPFSVDKRLYQTNELARLKLNGTIELIERVELVFESDEDFEISVEYVAPRNELEKQLVEIWQEILKIEKVGINDSFFDIGGTSLSIIMLYEKIKEIIDQPITVANLFSYHTIAMLTEHLESLTNPVEQEDDELDDLFSQLASGELSAENAADLFTGGR